MNRILAAAMSLALSGAAFAADPVKTESPKTESAAPTSAQNGSKGTQTKVEKVPTKSQPKGRRGVKSVAPVGTQPVVAQPAPATK